MPRMKRAVLATAIAALAMFAADARAVAPGFDLFQTDPEQNVFKFTGKYAHRDLTGGIGHNLPQEAPEAFAKAVVEADGWAAA